MTNKPVKVSFRPDCRFRFQIATQYSLVGIALLVLIALIIVFLLPLLASLSPLFTTNGDTSVSARITAKAALYTLQVAGGSMLVALLIGLPAAFFLARRNFPGRSILSSFSAVPLCTPPLLIALGFVMFFGMAGSFNKFLQAVFQLKQPPFTFLYSFWGIIIAQGFYNFPLVMQTCASVWEKLPQDESDAARLLGASEKRVFFTVTLRQLFPAIASSCTLVFLFCYFSFIIVMLFGNIGNATLEVEIYNASKVTLNFSQASLLAVIETTLALSVVFLINLLEKKNLHSQGLYFGAQPLWRKKLSGVTEKVTFVAFLVIVFLFLILPLAGIAWRGITSGAIKTLFTRPSFFYSLRNTLITSTCSALLATTAAAFYGISVRVFDPLHRHQILQVIPLLPMAVSSVVLGFGLTYLSLRGYPIILILAQAAVTWTFAYKQISSSIDRIPSETVEAARLLSKRRTDIVFKIYLPMIARPLLQAFSFCFAISAGDATLPLVLAIPKFDTLSLFTYRLAGAYRFSEACASGTILALFTAGVFYAGRVIGRKK